MPADSAAFTCDRPPLGWIVTRMSQMRKRRLREAEGGAQGQMAAEGSGVRRHAPLQSWPACSGGLRHKAARPRGGPWLWLRLQRERRMLAVPLGTVKQVRLVRSDR